MDRLEAQSDICRVALKKISKPSGRIDPIKIVVPSLSEVQAGITYLDKRHDFYVAKAKEQLQNHERMMAVNEYKVDSYTRMISLLTPISSEFKTKHEKAKQQLSGLKSEKKLNRWIVNDWKLIEDSTYEVSLKTEGGKSTSEKGIVIAQGQPCVRCSNSRMYLYAGDEPEMLMNGDTPVFGIIYKQAAKMDAGVDAYLRYEEIRKVSQRSDSDINGELTSFEYRLKELKSDMVWDEKKLIELKENLDKLVNGD